MKGHLDRPDDPYRAALWDRTIAEIKDLDRRIEDILSMPGYACCEGARQALYDLEQKREYRIGRLHII